MLLWMITYDVSFVLSQQVLLCPIIYTVILVRLLRILEDDIMRMSQEHGQPSMTGPDNGERLVRLRDRLGLWSIGYIAVKRFVDRINGVFSWILLVSVAFDLLTALGIGASLVTPHAENAWADVAFYVSSFILFMAYATVLLLPFVLLNNKVCCTK